MGCAQEVPTRNVDTEGADLPKLVVLLLLAWPRVGAFTGTG